MRPAAILSMIAAGFILALAQTLGTLSGTAPAIIIGVASGVMSLPLFRLFGIASDRLWVPVTTVVLASCVGTLTGSLGVAQAPPWQWLGPACALAACLGVESVKKARSRVCQLCRKRLIGTMVFECPRCGLFVCERKCWRFDSCRCRLCADHAVPVFPYESRWWDECLGSRLSGGKCQLCLSEGSAIDLRACVNCGRPQCRECWDYANGQCGHCGWILPDLPPALKGYMFPEGHSGRRTMGVRQ
jgi:hypothetical protein